MRGFMSNLFFRPSCHFCAYRELRSGSDITLADCWGIHHVYPDFDDDKGISLCIVKSDKFKIFHLPWNVYLLIWILFGNIIIAVSSRIQFLYIGRLSLMLFKRIRLVNIFLNMLHIRIRVCGQSYQECLIE